MASRKCYYIRKLFEILLENYRHVGLRHHLTRMRVAVNLDPIGNIPCRAPVSHSVCTSISPNYVEFEVLSHN